MDYGDYNVKIEDETLMKLAAISNGVNNKNASRWLYTYYR